MTLAFAVFVACPAEAERVPGSDDTAEPTATVGCEPERCNNGIDDDCDGAVDEADDAVDAVTVYTDADGDGYGGNLSARASCSGEGALLVGGDCDDADPLVSPDAEEECDGVDNDCDGHGVPGCEWEGTRRVEEVASFVARDSLADLAAGWDETSGEPWLMTFDAGIEVRLYRDLHAGRQWFPRASATWELEVDWYDAWYKEMEMVEVACGDVHDLDGDGVSDLVIGLEAYDRSSGNFGRLFGVQGPLQGIGAADLADTTGSFVGTGRVWFSGSQCGAGLDATGDEAPDVLALGIEADQALVLAGETVVAGSGPLGAAAEGAVTADGYGAGGGWADFDGDGTGDIYFVDYVDHEYLLRLFRGPTRGQVGAGEADTTFRVGRWPDFPDRQTDLTGDGLDDLLLRTGEAGLEWGAVCDGAELSQGSGELARLPLVATINGGPGRPIEQVAAAGARPGHEGASILVSHCVRFTAWAGGEDCVGGVSIVPGPYAGHVAVAHRASLYLPDPRQSHLGTEVASTAGYVFVGVDDLRIADGDWEVDGVYTIALDEAF